MCGRYVTSGSRELLIEMFTIDEVVEPLPGPRYNVAPTNTVPAVLERISDDQVRRKLVPLTWGLVPSWARDPSCGSRMINARVETLATKPSFRAALDRRRCLLPADGFYEWSARHGAAPTRKQPYFIHRADGNLMAMAGLYEFWKSPDGAWLSTCTIITTESSGVVAELHDRMPLVVNPTYWDDWLDPESYGDIIDVLRGETPQLAAYPVSTLVNNVGNDGPHLLDRVPESLGPH